MSDKLTEALKPCPFCGYENTGVVEALATYWAKCPKCGCSGPMKENEVDDAVAAWNSRPESVSGVSVPDEAGLPWKDDGNGDYIFDRNGNPIMQVRGWGHLEKLGDAKAEAIQIAIGKAVVAQMNALLTTAQPTAHRGDVDAVECQCWDCYKARYAEAKKTAPAQPRGEVGRETVAAKLKPVFESAGNRFAENVVKAISTGKPINSEPGRFADEVIDAVMSLHLAPIDGVPAVKEYLTVAPSDGVREAVEALKPNLVKAWASTFSGSGKMFNEFFENLKAGVK